MYTLLGKIWSVYHYKHMSGTTGAMGQPMEEQWNQEEYGLSVFHFRGFYQELLVVPKENILHSNK